MSFALTTLAQNYRGAIRGRVTDPRSASIPGAQVKLRVEGTNESRIVKTDGNVDFTISLLRPGSYQLQVESPGFSKFFNKITLQVNQDIRLDIALNVGAAIVDDNMIVAPVSALKYEGASL